MATRIERDSMGEMQVPEEALYGASTQRAVLNFPVSSLRFSPAFNAAVGLIKYAAAKANGDLDLLDKQKAEVIQRAAREVVDGKLQKHFVVDIFQTGSGTSTNMNANEVIANRAIELQGGNRGDKSIHPNDHVNMCQSSNDVIPSAIHISAYSEIEQRLKPALEKLAAALDAKAVEFKSVVKTGRTHLQDATPIMLGQEFSGYATQIHKGLKRISHAQENLAELALGGTAVGTGLNTHPEFAARAIKEIAALSGFPFREADNHFEAQGARDAAVELSGQLRTVATSLMKIANDIRWLASGPRCAIGELFLPEIQPGSSIMPAKVNPVVCESVMMVAAHVIGNDACIAVCGQQGNFELNVMMPAMGYNLLESIEILASVSENFVDQCVAGITANEARCRELADQSLSLCTPLAPKIGYDKAAKVAILAWAEGKSVRQAAIEMQVLDPAELERVLDLEKMTKPGL